MLDVSLLALDPARGERLSLDDYHQDFAERRNAVRGLDSWKLERRQHFLERNNPSWDAFRRGDWAESLRLIQETRPGLVELAQDDRRRGSVFRRVRVVARPLTPYVQWELNSLRVRAESGIPVRVVHVEDIGPLEAAGPLPELVSIGGHTLYSVQYTEEGLSDGAVRFTDPELVAGWTDLLRELYEAGEDLVAYVKREVAHLPAPPAWTEQDHQHSR
ncbi:DUF6879 family protein [Streptomyces millisiae]|uniref:DUF6879 domain-containing protein n=1 Tax=Streptomyces millisiae TaxID=3075542 RepID=A0ABU2LTE4_9ACTN|nr:DUF6879 family protein [Streptomyces sp. DSM 44918]MDT0320849.1 hypothetical protein [Streptomyces sp. DSM 44918]